MTIYVYSYKYMYIYRSISKSSEHCLICNNDKRICYAEIIRCVPMCMLVQLHDGIYASIAPLGASERCSALKMRLRWNMWHMWWLDFWHVLETTAIIFFDCTDTIFRTSSSVGRRHTPGLRHLGSLKTLIVRTRWTVPGFFPHIDMWGFCF